MTAEQVAILDRCFSDIYDACERLSDFNETVCDSRVSDSLELFLTACDKLCGILETEKCE